MKKITRAYNFGMASFRKVVLAGLVLSALCVTAGISLCSTGSDGGAACGTARRAERELAWGGAVPEADAAADNTGLVGDAPGRALTC